MRRKNIYYVACVLSLALMGCNSSDTASETTENAVSKETTEAQAEETETETATAELITEESSAFVGMVSAVNGSVVTLTAGEVSVLGHDMADDNSQGELFMMVPDSDDLSDSIMGEGNMPQMGEAPQMGQMPGGDMSGDQMPGGQMQFPGGDMQMEMPEGETFAEGEMPGGEMPGGEMPEGETFAEGGMQFERGMRGGDMQNMGPGNMDGGQGFGMEMDFSDYVPFTASGEDATEYDLSGVTIVDGDGNEVALEDIAVGDVLTITENDDGTYTVVWNGHGFDMSEFGQIKDMF